MYLAEIEHLELEGVAELEEDLEKRISVLKIDRKIELKDLIAKKLRLP